MNRILEERLKGIQQSLIAQYKGGKGLPSVTIGNERETFIREFLSKVLPGHYRFGTGAIIDSNKILTGQVDIVVELPYAPSFPMPSTSERLYIAEGVGATIEIKSDIGSQWEEMIQSIFKVKQLRKVAPYSYSMAIDDELPLQIPCFAIGYTGFKNVETIQNKLKILQNDMRPDGVLIVDTSCYVNKTNIYYGYSSFLAFIFDLFSEVSKLSTAKVDLSVYY